jgi:hypothetical protein
MKKILMTLTLLILSAAAVSSEVQPMTFDSFYLTKDSKNAYGLVYVPYRNVEAWCAQRGSPLNLMTLEVAQAMDNLADGLYNCTGKFVQIPTDRMFPIQIFQIDTCTEVNANHLKLSACKTTK